MNSPGELIDDLRLLEPQNPWLLYYWIGGALLGILAIILIVAGVRAWRRRRANAPEKNVRAAQVDALAGLERLLVLVRKHRARPYAIESSAVIRQYIEQRFEIRAPVQSTEEFLHAVQHSPLLAPEHQELLGHFLNCCDLLKFGRGVVSQEELEQLHAIAIEFVTETRGDHREVHG